MRRICLTVIGLFLMLVTAFSQSSYPIPTEEEYQKRRLTLEETNIISSYYTQTGNHSAVTGGIGTQKLSDVSNLINLRFVKWDLTERKHSLEIELGIDHHTAASSAYVSKTGASKTGGTRLYPSISWKVENEARRSSFGIGVAYSSEYNYHSYGANVQFSKTSRDKNRELDVKTQLFFDRVKLIQPSEFTPVVSQTVNTVTTASGRVIRTSSNSGASSGIPSSSRNTIATSISLSQVVNKRMQVALMTDVVAQQGYLGLPFHRVYFQDNSVHIENLPTTRLKLPVGIRLNYFASDNIVLRTYYRYYTDSWGLKAHTASLETVIKLTPFFSVSPFYRYYVQTAANYFAAYATHTAADQYYTSNYDYSAFTSQTIGVNFRIAPPKGVFGAEKFSLVEIRYANYHQTTGLQANNITVNFRFK